MTQKPALMALAQIHERLAPLSTIDNDVLRACNVAGLLDQQAQALAELDKLREIHTEFGKVAGAFNMLLRLFADGHRSEFDGDSIECLLSPLCEKLASANQQLSDFL